MAGDLLHAYGESTVLRVATTDRSRDVRTLSTPLEIPFHPLPRPLDEEVGVEVVEASSGVVRLSLHSGLLNPEGALQGALVALVTVCAALELAESGGGPPAVWTALDLRYLGAATEGPVTSRASWLDARSKEVIHVELHDEGRGRLTSTALVHVREVTR